MYESVCIYIHTYTFRYDTHTHVERLAEQQTIKPPNGLTIEPLIIVNGEWLVCILQEIGLNLSLPMKEDMHTFYFDSLQSMYGECTQNRHTHTHITGTSDRHHIYIYIFFI